MKGGEERTRDQGGVILIVGPESTGTRMWTSALSMHSAIEGTSSLASHDDYLDDVWSALQTESLAVCQQRFPSVNPGRAILTRRSLPHGEPAGSPAQFGVFPPLSQFAQLCKLKGLPMTALVTTRSPGPHLASWTLSRSSPGGDFQRTLEQYQLAYEAIFQFLSESGTNFFLISIEGLLLDGQHYLDSLFSLLGFAPEKIRLKLKLNRKVNRPRYGELREMAGRDLP